MPFYSTNPNQTVGGWASNPCNASLPYMCRMQNSQGSPVMTTASTNASFYFNTTFTTFLDAEKSCKDNGGHIAGYKTNEEQLEVGCGRGEGGGAAGARACGQLPTRPGGLGGGGVGSLLHASV